MKTFWSKSGKRLFGIAGVILVSGLVCATNVRGEIPRKINYQGVLTDLSGSPMPDGQYQMIFKIYNAATGGTPLWTEEWKEGAKVTLNGGLFNVLLGTINPINLLFDVAYWLEVQVYNTNTGLYETFLPRNELASAGYALRAARVADAAIDKNALAPDSITMEKISDGAITDSKVAASGLSALKITSDTINSARINWAEPGNIGTSTPGVGYFTNLFASGNIGIGTTSPAAKLEILSDQPSSVANLILKSGQDRTPRIQFKGPWSVDNPNEPYAEIKVVNDNGAGDASIRFVTSDYVGGTWHATLSEKMIIQSDGNIGIGTPSPGHKLDVNGDIHGTSYVCPGADLAEKLIVHPDYELSNRELKNKLSKLDLPDTEKKTMIERKEISKLDPGTVVVITDKGVVPCASENDTRLAGIISSKPAVRMASDGKGQYVALAGNVPCKVTGTIKAGDMLTTSTIEGHAQKAEQPALGAVVGKALEDFNGETGVINVWIGGV